MALLDKFLILFETDSKEASKDIDDLNKKLDETEQASQSAVNGMDDATESAIELGDGFSEATAMAAQFIGTYLALDAVLSTSLSVANKTDELGKLAQTYDLNMQKIDAWGAAVERNGGSAQAFTGELVNMQNQLNQIQFGGGQEIIQQLGMLGISAAGANGQIKDSLDIMLELSSVFEGMSAGRSAALGQRLGLDQGTILLLQQGRFQVSELVKQQEALGGATEKSYEAAANFNDALDNTGRSAEGLWQDFNTYLLPPLTKLLDLVTDVIQWMRENEQFTANFFVAMGVAIAALNAPILFIVGKFALITAAITGISLALAAVVEDLGAFFNGQKSAIGDFVNWVKGIFQELADYINGLFTFEWIQDLKDFFNVGANSGNLEIVQAYAANPLNASTSFTSYGAQSRTSTNTYNYSFNNSITAGGVTPEQVSGQMNDEFSRQIANANASLDNGIDR